MPSEVLFTWIFFPVLLPLSLWSTSSHITSRVDFTTHSIKSDFAWIHVQTILLNFYVILRSKWRGSEHYWPRSSTLNFLPARAARCCPASLHHQEQLLSTSNSVGSSHTLGTLLGTFHITDPIIHPEVLFTWIFFSVLLPLSLWSTSSHITSRVRLHNSLN